MAHPVGRKKSVALRKESVDRNLLVAGSLIMVGVALRKESVDRNISAVVSYNIQETSLSARRAWIEMAWVQEFPKLHQGRSPQGERG